MALYRREKGGSRMGIVTPIAEAKPVVILRNVKRQRYNPGRPVHHEQAGETSDWLMEALVTLACAVQIAIRYETVERKRPIQERYSDAFKASEELFLQISALHDPALDDNLITLLASEDRLRELLERLGNQRRKGRKRRVPAQLSPREIAALGIAILWQDLYGENPPWTSPRASDPCQSIWRAAGGSGTFTDWRVQLRRAVKLLDSPKAQILRELMERGTRAAFREGSIARERPRQPPIALA
ncbi:MAG TPA: hypothetical protein VH684_11570 [Xanthobacteraceae bacterium]